MPDYRKPVILNACPISDKGKREVGGGGLVIHLAHAEPGSKAVPALAHHFTSSSRPSSPSPQLLHPKRLELIRFDGCTGVGQQPLVVGEVVDRQEDRPEHFAGP